MIICGYAGTGKSTAAKKIKRVVDLESTPFQKDWDTYARVAKHMSDNGYTVLLSCHTELRQKLHEIGADYYVVFPKKNQREEYRKRYTDRGNTQEFIDNQMINWDKWVGQAFEFEKIIYLSTTPSGRVETMTDLLDDMIQYGEEILLN